MQDLKAKAVRGGFAKLCGQMANFALRLVFIAALARLLTPEDFGLVGMATIVTGVISVLTNAWLSSGSVQQSAIDERQSSTLFWVYLAFGAILCLLCAAAAPALATFYREPRLVWVTATLGLGCLFTTAGVQHFAILQRQLRYVLLAVIETTSLAASVAVGIGMAVAGFGYWSLVGAAIVLPASNTAGLWLGARWIPGRPHRDVDVRSTVGFGGMITLNILVVYIAYNLDKVIVGRVWGADALGVYGRAYQLATIPPENINAAIGGVAFSALSRLKEDPARFKRYFLRCYSLVMSISFPIIVLCGLCAPDIVYVVLGPGWDAAADVFRLLTPAALVFSIINPLGWLMFSLGLVGRSMRIALAIAPLVGAAYLAGLSYGPSGVAIALSIALTLWVVPHILWSVHGTTISLTDLVAAISRPFLSTLVAAVAAYAVLRACGNLPSPYLRLPIGAGAMFAIYLCMLLFAMGQLRTFVDLLNDLRRPLRADASS